MEALQFILGSFWHFVGTVILLTIVVEAIAAWRSGKGIL